jgi:hypothetical protein
MRASWHVTRRGARRSASCSGPQQVP